MKIRAATLTFLACIMALGVRTAQADDTWGTDWAAAKAEAAKSNKDILIDFTGSDWCGWCKRLVKEVFSQDGFKTYAAKNFVLLEIDFPQGKPQSDELKQQNKKLQADFGARGYPSIYLANAAGVPYAKTGYQRGGPEAYVKHLDELRKIRIDYDDAMTKANASKGLEKAKHLRAAIDPIPSELLSHYSDVAKQLETLDPQNSTGYRGKLATMELGALRAEAQKLGMAEKGDEILAKVDAFINDNELEGQAKQEALFIKLNAYPPSSLANLDKAEAVLDSITAIAPNTEIGKTCTQIKTRLPDLRKRLTDEKKK